MFRCFRLLLVLGHVLLGLIRLPLAARADRDHPGPDVHARRAQLQWSRGLCRILGLRLRFEGAPLAPAPLLLVGNHISWLDIPVLASRWPVVFLSKAEVSRWPLVGRVLRALGTLFIERGGRGAAAGACAAMSEKLLCGERVLFFPEGTTGDGSRLLPFRPRLFQAALDARSPVQCFAISYHRPDGSPWPEAAFIGEETLFRHLWRLLGMRGLEVRVRLAPPLAPAQPERSTLARRSQETVGALRTQRWAALSHG